MSSQIIYIEANSLKESYEFNKVAKQADSAVLYRQNRVVLLATVTIDKNSGKEDFLPLTVVYIEKSYAAAKIPGGFIKRESKPSDFESLTSRIVDRALRPLFPKDFTNSVIINITVLSSDNEVDLQVAALHAANAALMVSSLPINKSIAAVRIGKIDNKIVINPSLCDFNKSSLDLLLVGSNEDIAMIEMRAISTKDGDDYKINELPKETLLSTLKDGTLAIANASKEFIKNFSPLKSKNIFNINRKELNSELLELINSSFSDKIYLAIESMSKSERADALDLILSDVAKNLEIKDIAFDELELKNIFNSIVKNKIRELILSGDRLDGRSATEVRPIEIETNILPSVHSSTLFTRGETQALVTLTLGSNKDAQMYEMLTGNSAKNENFMVHYNFPPYSVGEARPIGAPSRRELGHGNLAKKALEPTVELEDNQTIRLVSEILQSNGSSSMATVCGGSLALYAANINVKKLVAGIAMGAVIESNDRYTILTDIMGIEDHYGDIDLKIAATKDGVTAMQMDIKVDGLDLKILSETINQATKGIEYIISLMHEAKKTIVPSVALPLFISFSVDLSKIPMIIGKGGSTIREIIEKFNVSIDLNRDKCLVKISGTNVEDIENAKCHIEKLIKNDSKQITKYEVGKIYKGVVKKKADFGFFVEMPDGYDALLHNSKVPNSLQNSLKEGDKIEVVVASQKDKRVELIVKQ